ncbi:uncharacterized protein LOC141595229 [Silene latifolia]|uniref:uncharacterized protein LOC141595229 n=1 Tax=Silene latifolia TaxID=37657 RepID=UPI003D77ADB6
MKAAAFHSLTEQGKQAYLKDIANKFKTTKLLVHKVESICRAYLWSVSDEHHKVPAVAWDKCCLPKAQGGLGIINCYNWNIATLGKYIWWVANKKDCFWVNVHWQPYVWNRLALPKVNFINWLFIQGRLLTKDRLAKFGVINDGVCFLCGNMQETSLHLFFECPFSLRCLRLLQTWLGFSWTTDIKDNSLKWRGRSLLRKKLILAALASLVYYIWEGRNKCRIGDWVPRPENVRKRIHDVLRGRMHMLKLEKVPSRDMVWVQDVILC